MNRRLLIILLISLLVSLVAAFFFWPGADRQIDPSGLAGEGATSALSGVVVDHAGRPIRNAEILVGDLSASSDQSGAFAFPELPTGTLTLDARASGYVRPDPGRITLEYNAEPIENLRVTLQRRAQITGRILANQRSVSDAQISISYVFAQGLDNGQLDPFTASAVVASSLDGRFGLSDLAPGRLHLLIESPDHPFFESREIFLRPGQQINNLQFEIAILDEEPLVEKEALPDGVFGQVRLTNGNAVNNAQVIFTDPSGEEIYRLRANNQGFFEWADAPDEPLRVRAISAFHDPSPVYPVRPGEETILEMIPGGTIQGFVLDQNRRPVRRYSVSVAFAEFARDHRHGVNQLPSQHVDVPTGRFELGPLPSGRFRLVVQAEGYAPTTTEPFTVQPDRRTGPVSITLQRGGTLEGTVVDIETGEPIPGARIQHTTRMTDGSHLQTSTDSDGNFLLEELPPGPQAFTLFHRDYITHQFSNITIADDGNVSYEFTLEPVVDGRRGMTFAGIGAALANRGDGVEVTGLTTDSAATRAGLMQGDRITAVDGLSTTEMTLDQVIAQIRGEEGVPVVLDITRPGGGARRIEIQRERVFIAQPNRPGIR